MTVVRNCALFAGVRCGSFHAAHIQKFNAIVHCDCFKTFFEILIPVYLFYLVKNRNNAFLRFVRDLENIFISGFSFREDKQAILFTALRSNNSIHFPVTGNITLQNVFFAFFNTASTQVLFCYAGYMTHIFLFPAALYGQVFVCHVQENSFIHVAIQGI